MLDYPYLVLNAARILIALVTYGALTSTTH